MPDMMYMIRKISDPNSYSKGRVEEAYNPHGNKKIYCVTFRKNGKVWTSEKTIKDHILKCFQNGVSTDDWEVIEVKYHPTKPIKDWVDAKMFMKILKEA